VGGRAQALKIKQNFPEKYGIGHITIYLQLNFLPMTTDQLKDLKARVSALRGYL
jgi:hypothetical protein